jgi:hypothetical protein
VGRCDWVVDPSQNQFAYLTCIVQMGELVRLRQIIQLVIDWAFSLRLRQLLCVGPWIYPNAGFDLIIWVIAWGFAWMCDTLMAAWWVLRVSQLVRVTVELIWRHINLRIRAQSWCVKFLYLNDYFQIVASWLLWLLCLNGISVSLIFKSFTK